MAFGDASQQFINVPAASSAKAQHDSPPPQPPNRTDSLTDVAAANTTEVLDRDWILGHLRTLNNIGRPRLSEAQLFDLCINVVEEQVAASLSRPVHEVFTHIAPILASAVVSAKTPSNTGESAMANTPLLGQFLVQINGFIKARNETSLSEWLALEPPFNNHYTGMIQELQSSYSPSATNSAPALEQQCTKALPAAVEGDDGSSWTPFIKFMAQYLAYLRDVSADASKYLHTYELLSELQQRANSALGHSSLGHMVLPVVVRVAKLVCRLAIGLDKQPELIAHLRRSGDAAGGGGGEEGGARETLPERAANILRHAFVTCLNDRVSGLGADGRPEGKKRGIYIIANLCLKILFQCRKTRNATQIFENIYNLSPPLSAYPKSQRVTYLYYLGRFLFQNSHFYRAQLALKYAYEEAPANPQCMRQRRHILVYLIASNIILGRFPSQALLARPEAQGLADRFMPICHAIQQGNAAAFRQHLDLDGPHAEWFLHFRILLQLRNRCEVLVWRSLIRKTFILVGYRPADTMGKVAPTLLLEHLVTAFKLVSRREASDEYTDPDFTDIDFGDTGPNVDVTAVESKLASLIDQGLLSGFISRRQGKFAIQGTKAKGGDALRAGFPNAWEVLSGKAERSGSAAEVPGWKKSEQGLGGARAGGFGPGMVVSLSGLREIGAAS